MVVAPNSPARDLAVADGTSPSARGAYQSSGVILVRQLFSPEETDHIRKVFTDHIESSDPTAKDHPKGWKADDILQRYPRLIMPHRYPHIAPGKVSLDLIMDERILGVVENLIGPAWGAQTMFYFKPPTARGQALHQDNYFLQSHPETCLAAWMAVDDADAENGGLRVIPGSHANEVLCHGDSNLEVSFSPTEVILPTGVRAEEMLVQTQMKAGDVLFFHGSLVHGSLPNTSDRFRRALIFHYCPQASTRITKYYQPLVNHAREEVWIDESLRGGPCGDKWEMAPGSGDVQAH